MRQRSPIHPNDPVAGKGGQDEGSPCSAPRRLEEERLDHKAGDLAQLEPDVDPAHHRDLALAAVAAEQDPNTEPLGRPLGRASRRRHLLYGLLGGQQGAATGRPALGAALRPPAGLAALVRGRRGVGLGPDQLGVDNPLLLRRESHLITNGYLFSSQALDSMRRKGAPSGELCRPCPKLGSRALESAADKPERRLTNSLGRGAPGPALGRAPSFVISGRS